MEDIKKRFLNMPLHYHYDIEFDNSDGREVNQIYKEHLLLHIKFLKKNKKMS